MHVTLTGVLPAVEADESRDPMAHAALVAPIAATASRRPMGLADAASER